MTRPLTEDPAHYLQPTPYLDADHPRVAALAGEATSGITAPLERGVRLFYAVRDGFPYDPYGLDLGDDGFRASTVVSRGRGYCVTKAGLLAAAARAAGIPARLGFADVRNHLTTPRLQELMRTDVFYYHGYTELFLDGRWVKATPAFNIGLCERFGVKPLEFDGRNDSLFHPFDHVNRRHMEYLRDHGPRDDMPVDEIREAMRRHYPHLSATAPGGDFHAESSGETRR